MNNTQAQQVVVKYSTQLPPDLIKWVKRQALEQDVRDYRLIRQALEEFRDRVEQQSSRQVQLDLIGATLS